MIRVLIADDSEFVLDDLVTLFEATSDIEVVGLARDGLEAFERAQELSPDVVIMDLRMPRMDGLETTRRIKEPLPTTGVLFLSDSTDYDDIEASIAAGGDGYLTKPPDEEKLVDFVRQIAAKYEALRSDGGAISQ